MFALGPVEIVGIVLLAVGLEVILFWAAAALADAPPLGWGKIVVVSLFVGAVWVAVDGAITWSFGPGRLMAPDNRVMLVGIAGLALVVSWVIPAVLYIPLVPVSVPRSMLLSVCQVLLRIFLYVFILAIAAVILAVVQIVRGPQVRTGMLAPIDLFLGLFA